MRRHRIDLVAEGLAAERAGRLNEAEELYRAAIRRRDAHAYNNLAQLLIETGRASDGEVLFREGVKARDALAAKNLALFLIEEGREVAASKAIAIARSLGSPPTAKEIAGARSYAKGVEDDERPAPTARACRGRGEIYESSAHAPVEAPWIIPPRWPDPTTS